MIKNEFKSLFPHLEEWTKFSINDVEVSLMRCSGFLEAVEGMKANPEIASRMNLNEIRLLQVMVRLAFSLQCRILDNQNEMVEAVKARRENEDLHSLAAHATEEMSNLKEKFDKLKEEHGKLLENVTYYREKYKE